MTRPHPALAFLLLAASASAQTPPAPAPEEDPAVALFKQGKLDDALKELQKSSRANPQLPPARVRLAELLLGVGQPAAARGQMEVAAVEDPGHPAVFLMNGSMAFGDGRMTDTILSCRAALQAADSPRWDPAQKQKFTREARLGLAAAFEARRDWAAAKEQLAAVLQADPKDSGARGRMAAVTFWLGGPEQAFTELHALHRDDPATELPELRMAQLWGAKDDQAKVEDWLKKAVTAHPKAVKAPRVYAGYLIDGGRPDAAAVYVEAAAKLDPTGRETLALKGLLARYRKDFAAAEAAFEGMHKEHPNDPFAALNLALVLAESADPAKKKRAVDLAEAEVRKNPRAVEGYAVLGWAYYKAGRAEDANKAIAQAVSAGQVRFDTAYFAARLLADQGKTDEAVSLLRGALAGRGPFPYRSDAQTLLTELEKKLPPKK